MTKHIDQLRRDATALKKAFHDQIGDAILRVNNHRPRGSGAVLKHADFLHVIARELGFATWPALKAAVELQGMDRAPRQRRLAHALEHGQEAIVLKLLEDDASLPDGHPALNLMLYRRDAVDTAGPASLSVLARSKAIHIFPDREAEMLAIADSLLKQGADVNHAENGLSTLYFAIGHAGNMALGEWLLDNGADPNDGETLYHATELGHHGGLRLLLAHGADPKGTNALLRAMDFHDVEAVQLLLDAGAQVEDFNADEVGGEAPWTIPALHQAARRMSPPAMVDVLLDNGADPRRIHDGLSPYGAARIFGNVDLARALETHGHATPLSPQEALLARVADGEEPRGEYIDPAKLPGAARNMMGEIVTLPGALPHLKRLAAVGVEYDRPDAAGVPPVQTAGWNGLPEVMQVLLRLKPDLGHVNEYGGTLLGTILHGAENCPDAAERDHLSCLQLALEEGVALPRGVWDHVADPDLAGFLRDWAEAKPGQVVDG